MFGVPNGEMMIEKFLQEEAQRHSDVRKAYLERNRERIKRYQTEYYKQNKAEMNKTAKEFYQANKDAKNAKMVCQQCGKEYTQQNRKRHEKTKYHIEKKMSETIV